jgi:ankyrin repeat protein
MSLERLKKAAVQGDAATVRSTLKRSPGLAGEWKPLLDACYRGHAEVVSALLAAGADPNVESGSRWRARPLHRVCEFQVTLPRSEGHVETLRALLAAGADPKARTPRGETPLMLAAIAGEPSMVALLRRRVRDLDAATAALLGDAEHLGALLEQQPRRARAAARSGATPLWYCARSRLPLANGRFRRGVLECAGTLLRAGASPNPVVAEGGPALFQALAHARNPELAELLLEAGAQPGDGGTPVHVHTHFPHLLEALDWLIERGTNLDAQADPDASTALHMAVRNGYLRVIRFLLERGADPGLKDANGRTALDLAREQGRAPLIAALEGAASGKAAPRAPRKRARRAEPRAAL